MANTFTQLHIQIIFAVKERYCLFRQEHNKPLQKYITGIVKKKDHKLLAINNMPDHIHIFIGYNPKEGLSSIIREIKANSSKYINDNNWFKGKFVWQAGYGAFSYSHSHIDQVCKYIENQEKHHQNTTYQEEYKSLLDKFEINYNQKYLLDWE